MLILKYFLSVGTVLMIGLFALSARMETDKAASSPRIHSSASIAIAPPPPAPAAKTIQIDEPIAPVAEFEDQAFVDPPRIRLGASPRTDLLSPAAAAGAAAFARLFPLVSQPRLGWRRSSFLDSPFFSSF